MEPPDTDPPLDSDRLAELRRIFEEPEELSTLFQTFFEDLPQRLQALRRGVDHCHVDEVDRIAHSIKGSSGNLGAGAVSSVAGVLERKAREANLEEAGALLDELEQELTRLREWLARERLL